MVCATEMAHVAVRAVGAALPAKTMKTAPASLPVAGHSGVNVC